MTPFATPRPEPTSHRRRRSIRTGLTLAAAAVTLAACGGSATTSAPSTNQPSVSAAADQILPVTSNPISNASTNQTLSIDSVLVENNVDPATGKDASDHLEIALTNTGTATLSGFEVFYTYDDAIDGVAESYYARLPDTFTIAAGASRVIHFDDTGAPDHFPDNRYSLYHTSLNAMDVTVEVSATDAAPQTLTVQKDKGGEEVAD
jgi:hypothetical protein